MKQQRYGLTGDVPVVGVWRQSVGNAYAQWHHYLNADTIASHVVVTKSFGTTSSEITKNDSGSL